MSFDKGKLPAPQEYFLSQDIELKGHRRSIWQTAPCRFHGGSDSMRVNTLNGAWICMACGERGGDVLSYHMRATGMDFCAAAKALGAWEGNDPARADSLKPRPLPASAALQVLRDESLLAAVAACNVAQGVSLSDVDRSRLVQASARISRIAEMYRG